MTEYYERKLQQGLEYQDFVSDKLRVEGFNIGVYSSRKYQLQHGESAIGIEIKFDNRFSETGNLYIETHEKSDARMQNYVLSGINREDKTWGYLIGNYNEAFLLNKKQLREICGWAIERQRNYNMYRRETPTSKGLTIPVSYIKKSSCCLIHFIF